MRRLIAPLLLLIAVGVALTLTAGRGDSMHDETPEPAAPAITLPRLDGSADFVLSDLASARTPTLLWFWAPWCEVCNGEAPKIEQLAAQAKGELAVVAIGGRDDVTNGPAFVERHRLRSPTVLFDEALTAWRAYRIPGQPGAVLLDRRRRERGRWLGAFDTDLALEAARAL
jgi:thiol-disulfide isomerase/thioredoxin